MTVEPLRVAPPSFVGRSVALADLSAAVSMPPSLTVIEGDPGIGKTRLLQEAGIIGRNRTALLAACPPLREPFALGPVVDGLRRLGARAAVPRLSPLGGALHPLLPEWVEMLPPPLEPLEDPRATRHRLFRALSELVERLAVDTVVVEDAQWADGSTLEWLLTLTAAGDSGPSIVVTYRPHEIPTGSPLLRLASRGPHGGVHARIELEPLDVGEVRDLIGSMLDTDEVSDRFAAFLHAHTDGNPLAVEETIRLMRDRHELIRTGGSWNRPMLDELQVPPTVRDSVLERIDRLAWNTRQVLRAAATLAAPADPEMLIAVAGLTGPSGRRGVAGGLTAGLLREAAGGGLEFRHSLDAKAVEEATPVSVQWALHRRAAEVLQRQDPAPVTRLARHYREARDVDQWCRFAEASADVAVKSGDDRAGVMTLLDVLTSAEHPIDRRYRLAMKLSDAAFFGAAVLGDVADDVVAALREVLAHPELQRNRRGELRLMLGRMLWRAGHELDSVDQLEAAIPDLDHRPDLAARAMANLAMPVTSHWPVAQHLHWLSRAEELVHENGSELDKLALAANRATTLLLVGDEFGWQTVEEVRRAGTDPDAMRLAAPGLLNIAEASLVWGRLEDTRSLLDDATTIIRTARYQRFLTTELVVESYLDWYRGNWESLREAAAGLADSAETEPVYQIRARHLLAMLDLAESGRAAEPRLRELLAESARRGVAEPEVAFLPAALARLLNVEGDHAAAVEVTQPIADMVVRKQVWIWATDVAPAHVEALIGVGRLAEATHWAERFVSGLADCQAPAAVTAASTTRGLLAAAHGDAVAAAAHYADAAGRWARLPRPYDELLVRERLGRLLLADEGRGEEGMEVLAEAETRLRMLGARWDADRVARILREHGVEVNRTWRRGPRGYGDQLSPRELECVALVAQGMRNKQVADSLFLSPRTVERHLRSAMRKLNVTSRTALAMAAVEQGVLPAAQAR